MAKPKKLKKSKKYTLSKPYRAIAYQLNKAYDEVVDAGLTSNNIRLFELTLENFYAKVGKKVANPHHISMQVQLTKDQAMELAKITDAFVDIALTERAFYLDDLTRGLSDEDKQRIQDIQQDMEYQRIVTPDDELEIPWERFDVDKFEAIRDKYGVDDIQGFIDWTDEMERFRGSAFLREVFTSDQIADIFAYGIDKSTDKVGYGFNEITKFALNIYNKYGYVGDDLRNAVMRRIKTHA